MVEDVCDEVGVKVSVELVVGVDDCVCVSDVVPVEVWVAVREVVISVVVSVVVLVDVDVVLGVVISHVANVPSRNESIAKLSVVTCVEHKPGS